MVKSTQKYRKQQSATTSNSLVDAKYPVPQIMSGTADIRNLSFEQRQGLLDGPQLQVLIGTTRVGYVQKRAIMALSPKLSTFLCENPLVAELRFKAEDIDEEATKALLRFFSHRHLGAAIPGKLPMGKDFIQAVQNYRAAVCFGLDKHTSHIKYVLHQSIGNDDILLAYEELDTLLACVSSEDKLFIHAAQQYARLRYKNEIPDPEDFSHFVAAHPEFAKAIADIDAKHTAEREAYEARARKREEYEAWKERQKKREAWQQRKQAAEKAAAERKKEGKNARKAEKAAREPRPAVGLSRDLKPEDRARLKRLFHSD